MISANSASTSSAVINHSPMSTALELAGVHYHYRTDWRFAKVPVLRGVSLQVREGESFGFLGHNGAGKTTTIKAILGLIHLRRGIIRIFGQDHQEHHARAHVGYLPEQPYFYDNVRVREILEFYASLSGVARSDTPDEVSRVLAVVGLSGRANSKMRALSKGLTQRVALAQALLNRPRLLILDEPFSGLDPMGRREFRDILAELKRDGVTIFMSSHILSDVEFLCDRASIMVKGEIKGVYDLKDSTQHFSHSSYQLVVRADSNFLARCPVTPDKVRSEDRFLRLQFTERSSAEQALQTALSLGYEVQNFELEHPSLEDVFMDIAQQEGLGVRG